MSRVRLPVSGMAIRLREPDGHDALMLARPGLSGLDLAVAVLDRLAPPEDGGLWDDLPRADVDPACLAIRQAMVGERIVAEIGCTKCGGKGDMTFAVGPYLAAHRPRLPRGVRAGEGRWLHCDGARFRAPTVGEVRAAARAGGALAAQAQALEDVSIEADDAAGQRRARRALAAAAPMLPGPVTGACPQCRAAIDAWFDPAAFVLAELAQAMAGVFEEVDQIAARYGWPEAAILDLPGWRRQRYAALCEARPSSTRMATG